MKKLLIIFLLSLSSYATEKVTTPNDVIPQLENVIEKGWSNANQTLNNFIIKSEVTNIPKILKLLDKPLSIKGEVHIVGNEYNPKLLLTNADYIKLFSYVKYLEHNSKEKKAYSIVIKALKGLNNTESRSMLSLMFHMVNEKIIVKSLKESLQHHRFSKEQRVALKKELGELLLLDYQLLFESIDYENMITDKLLEDSYLKENSNQEEKKLMSKVLFYSKEYCINYNKKLKKAILSNSIDELETHLKKEIEEFESFKNTTNLMLDSFKRKLANYLPLSSDYTVLAKYLAKSNFMFATPSVFKTYKDDMAQVKSNQAFLESI